jgi:hypothetical protein
LHFVKVVGTQLQVAPAGQFASAAAELVIKISDAPVMNPATSRHDIRYIDDLLFSAVDKPTIVIGDCHSKTTQAFPEALVCSRFCGGRWLGSCGSDIACLPHSAMVHITRRQFMNNTE